MIFVGIYLIHFDHTHSLIWLFWDDILICSQSQPFIPSPPASTSRLLGLETLRPHMGFAIATYQFREIRVILPSKEYVYFHKLLLSELISRILSFIISELILINQQSFLKPFKILSKIYSSFPISFDAPIQEGENLLADLHSAPQIRSLS